MAYNDPLPAHLVDMTQAKWDALRPHEREQMRDMSECNHALLPYVGRTVTVTPKRKYGRSRFRVGMTTGWRPCLLAMSTRHNARGSSDVIGADEHFDTIRLG